MKKKLLLSIAVIAVIGFVVGGVIFCKRKNEKHTAITYEQFKEYVEQNNYAFQDNADIVPVDTIGKSCAANIEEYVQVEFLECISPEVAKQLFLNYMQFAEQFKDNSSAESTINFEHYGSYTLETADMYMHMTRIDHTIMDTRVPKGNKDIVTHVMKDLKYLN